MALFVEYTAVFHVENVSHALVASVKLRCTDSDFFLDKESSRHF